MHLGIPLPGGCVIVLFSCAVGFTRERSGLADATVKMSADAA